LFTLNRVFKHKEVVFNKYVSSNDLWKMWVSYIFHFPKTVNPPHQQNNLIIFSKSYCNDVQQSLFSWRNLQKQTLANTLLLKFPSKILFGTDMFTFYIDYVDYETSKSSWHIWNDDRTKIIVLSLFHFATRLNSRNQNETEIHNEHSYINL